MGNPRFFQPIIDTDTFNRLQILLKQNTHNRGAESELVNIFKGLLFCKCGCRMNVVSQSIDYRTKKKWAKAYRHARCYSVGVGSPCEHRFCIPLEQIEEEFFVHCVMMDPRQMLSKTDNAEKKALNSEISRNQAKFHLLTQQIKKLLDLSQTFDLSELKQKLAALEKERETTKTEIDNLNLELMKTETTPIEFDDIKRIVSDFHSSLKRGIDDSESKAERAFNEMVWKIQEILKDNDIRRQLQVMLPRVIGKLVVDSVANVFQVFNHSGKCVYTSLGLA